MLNVVLVEPEIPANTGNIGRTCVICGARLHLVAPRFDLSDKAVKRAGLAYWQSLDLACYPSWEAFLEKNPQAARALSSSGNSPADAGGGAPAVHLLTKAGARVFSEARYHENDYLVFGKESTGLDRELLAAHPELCERIPSRHDEVLANADEWHRAHARQHPELKRDICGNFVDPRAGEVVSLNLSNAAAIVLYEALRQLGYPGLR